MTRIRRFVNTSGSHNKFWEIWLSDVIGTPHINRRHGKIGTSGQSTDTQCSNLHTAVNLAAKFVEQKLAHGYHEVCLTMSTKLFAKPPEREIPCASRGPICKSDTVIEPASWDLATALAETSSSLALAVPESEVGPATLDQLRNKYAFKG